MDLFVSARDRVYDMHLQVLSSMYRIWSFSYIECEACSCWNSHRTILGVGGKKECFEREVFENVKAVSCVKGCIPIARTNVPL